MPRMPGAIWRPLPEDQTQPNHTKTQLVYHTTASHAPAKNIAAYFAQPTVNTESTFVVDLDGTIYQLLDSDRRADANYAANGPAISVETVGLGGTEPWTPQQLKSLERIARWAHANHPIPLIKAPGPDQPGLGYHSLYKEWNESSHACPGSARQAQFEGDLLPLLQEEVVAISDADRAQLVKEMWGAEVTVGTERLTLAQCVIRILKAVK